jgi:hypothetical protein
MTKHAGSISGGIAMKIRAAWIAMFWALCLAQAGAAQTPPVLSDDNIVKSEGPRLVNRGDIRLVNPGDKPIAVASAAWTVNRTSGTATYPLPDDEARLTTTCPRGPEKPAKMLRQIPPLSGCLIRVTLPNMTQPGRYTAKVLLYPASGTRKEVSLDFAYRRPLYWAILLIVAGLVAGGLVSYWRGGGRERAERVIRIKQAIEALSVLATKFPQGRVEAVIRRADEMQLSILNGEAGDDAQIAELALRPGQYQFLVDIRQAAAGIDPTKRKPLDDLIDRVIDKMAPLNGRFEPVPREDFDAVQQKLRELLQTQAKLLDEQSTIAGLPLPITLAMSSDRARTVLGYADAIVAAVLLLIFVAIGLRTLYEANPYWGNYEDMLAAFLLGFGAYAGAVASVTTFVQRAKSPPIG